MLGTTETAVKASLQRARSSLSQRRPAGPRHPCPSAGELALARRFADAFQADDIDGVVGLLTERAWLAMPPAPHEYHGRAAIASFLRASAAWRAGRRFLLIPTRSNGQPAFGCYLEALEGATAQAAGVIVLTLDGDQICTITRFLDNSILRYFGFPRTLSEHVTVQTPL
jgi:RNA polymerase sigma-70 factor (ECF subfamily)